MDHAEPEPEAELDPTAESEVLVNESAMVSKSDTLTPAEAIERLQRGETIENARIVGLKLKGEIPFPIAFRNVTLVKVLIEKATFAEDVTFEHCTIEGLRAARSATFAKGLSFQGSTLNKVNLQDLTVKGAFRCGNAAIRGRFVLTKAKFAGTVRFWDARFLGWVNFKNCEFDDVSDFRSIYVEQGFVADQCVFHKDVLFRGATISKKWQAEGTKFEGLLDFSKAKLHDFTYLESIEQGPAMQFSFLNAVAERVLVRPEQLEGRLASEKSHNHAVAMQEYGFLKRIFEGLHRYEQEDWAFYRFKVNQRLSKARSWRRPSTKLSQFFDWLLLDLGCGYGTNPSRAVRAALLIILGFGAIYATGIDLLSVDKPPFEGPPTTLANRLMIAALTSVSAFTSGFGDIRGAAQGWMNLPLIAESLLGTLLWGLFIVAFSRKVIR